MNPIEFSYYVGTHIVFAEKASSKVAKQLLNGGLKRPLLITDSGIIKAGVCETITKALEKSQIEFEIFDEVPPNPPSEVIMKGVDRLIEGEFDAVIALGGGSVMDAAKAIGIMAVHEGGINEYDSIKGSRGFTKRGIPVFTIPTTAGTGSEVTHWAVITDEKDERKQTIGHPLMAPMTAFVDPSLLHGLPASLTAATGSDALTHAIEAYTSKNAINDQSPLTDAIALQAITLITSNLRQAFKSGTDKEAREKTMAGSLLAGIAFQNVGLGNTHAMAHPLGGRYQVPHGIANAILLPEVMQYNLDASPRRFADIALAMGASVEQLTEMEAGQKAIELVRQLFTDIEIPHLSSFNIPADAYEQLAKDAGSDVCKFSNPKDTSTEQFLHLYKKVT